MVAALRFFLGKDENDEEKDSDSDDEVCWFRIMIVSTTLCE